MRKNTGKEKGLIVCTSSNAGLYPFPMAPLYAIAKHGIVGAVRSFAPLLQEEGIRINAVCPNCIGISPFFSEPQSSRAETNERITQQRVLQTIN